MERDVAKAVEEREQMIVRFAGDSGDGMQLVGSRFTDATAVLGNDLATMPNFPAEIRAPAGMLAGVSAFQMHFVRHAAVAVLLVAPIVLDGPTRRLPCDGLADVTRV
jgi:hypothetical protein